jgi:hypothetical protein
MNECLLIVKLQTMVSHRRLKQLAIDVQHHIPDTGLFNDSGSFIRRAAAACNAAIDGNGSL